MFYLLEMFIVNQIMTIISFCKTLIFPNFMFLYPSFQIVCDTNVQNIFVFVGHDVNEVVVKEGHDFLDLENNAVISNDAGWHCAGASEKSPKDKKCHSEKKMLKGQVVPGRFLVAPNVASLEMTTGLCFGGQILFEEIPA